MLDNIIKWREWNESKLALMKECMITRKYKIRFDVEIYVSPGEHIIRSAYVGMQCL
jgi:hypothetical protein